MSDFVKVPKTELAKLEKARLELYNLLSDRLDSNEFFALASVTGQIWRVANTKIWMKDHE